MIEKPHRIVLDTNIIISGFLQPKSIPAQAMIAAFRSGGVLLSAAVLAEFQEVLSRTKFNHHSDLEVRLRYLASLKNAATLVEIIDFVHDCRDPREDKFLELVLNGHANVLITGDQDLLTPPMARCPDPEPCPLSCANCPSCAASAPRLA